MFVSSEGKEGREVDGSGTRRWGLEDNGGAVTSSPIFAGRCSDNVDHVAGEPLAARTAPAPTSALFTKVGGELG